MESNYTRSSHFDGIFYPRKKEELKKNIFYLLNKSQIESEISDHSKTKIYGIVVPHASFTFSGLVAAYGYNHLIHKWNKNILIIGTNHQGIGNKISIMSQGIWSNPLGSIEINKEITERIIKEGNKKIFDELIPFKNDHTIEVQLPFIQTIFTNEVKIVPVLLLDQSHKNVKNFSNIISKAMINTDNIMVVGTSNLGHYENEFSARMYSVELIDAIKNLDVKHFYKIISKINGSVCGYGAIASVMKIVKSLGASKGILVKHDNNKTIENKSETVISYVSMVFT